MNDGPSIRWLHRQLPALVEKGVIAPEVAETLRGHFPEAKPTVGLGVIVSAILGATLIGAGIILVLAHNWDELDRPMRTVISFLPLAIGIAFSVFTLLRRASSAAWREGAAIFQMLAVAAGIALVGQTWHIAGDFYDFLLTWMLLSIPLGYLLGATLPVAGYIAGITVWAGGVTWHGDSSLWAWPLLAASVPYYLSRLKENRHGHAASGLSLLFALSIPLTLGFTLDRAAAYFWIPISAGLFTALYLTGVLWFEDHEHRAHPFRAVGALGVAVLSILFSYREIWPSSHSAHYPEQHATIGWSAAIGLPLLASLLALFCLKNKRSPNPAAALLPAAALCGWLMIRAGRDAIPIALFFNAFARNSISTAVPSAIF